MNYRPLDRLEIECRFLADRCAEWLGSGSSASRAFERLDSKSTDFTSLLESLLEPAQPADDDDADPEQTRAAERWLNGFREHVLSALPLLQEALVVGPIGPGRHGQQRVPKIIELVEQRIAKVDALLLSDEQSLLLERAQTQVAKAKDACAQAKVALEETEAPRQAADAARQAADEARQAADEAREAAEAAREEAEAASAKAEATSEEADAARKGAEAAHKEADAARKEADAARKEKVSADMWARALEEAEEALQALLHIGAASAAGGGVSALRPLVDARRSKTYPSSPEALSAAGRTLFALIHNLLGYQTLVERHAAWQRTAKRSIHMRLRRWGNAIRRRKTPPPKAPEPIVRPLKSLKAALDRDFESLLESGLSAADLAAGFVALLALPYLLAGRSPAPTFDSDRDLWWELVGPRAAKSIRSLLLRLVGAFPPLGAVSPHLAKHAQARKPRPPVQISEQLRVQLRMLEQFSSALVELGRGLAGDRPHVDEPLVIGDIGEAAVSGFVQLHSPALGPASAERLREVLVKQLANYERKLFAATVAPRPRFVNEFLDWAMERFVLFRGDHFPLSPLCLHAMLFCYDVLVLERLLARLANLDRELGKLNPKIKKVSQEKDAELDKRTRERLKEELAGLRAQREGLLAQHAGLGPSVERCRKGLKVVRPQLVDPSIGDMLAIHLALAGMARVLARSSTRPRWAKVLQALPSEDLRDDILRLVTLSPLTQIVEPELARVLASRAETATEDSSLRAWSHLEVFLDDARGGPLRQYALRELVAAATGENGKVPFALSVFRRCLDTGTAGGALFVGEFFVILFRHIMSDPALDMLRRRVSHRIAAGGGLYQAQALEQELAQATARFASWFFPTRPVVPTSLQEDNHVSSRQELVLNLLVDLLVLKQELERTEDLRPGDRQLLQGFWHEISASGTRGLRERAWERRPRRMLQVFWLSFCKLALASDDQLSVGLDIGTPMWDDLSELGSATWLELLRTSASFDNRKRQIEALGIDGRVDDDDEDFAVITVLVASLAQGQSTERSKLDPFQRALRVRQYLIPTIDESGAEGPRVVVNPELLGAKTHAQSERSEGSREVRHSGVDPGAGDHVTRAEVRDQ